MGRYAIDGEKTTVTTGLLTAVNIIGAATRRIRLYDFTLSVPTAPDDNVLEWILQRSTVVGTGTPVVPQALDPADPTAVATADEDHSVEPTYTADEILWKGAMNQRATYRWVAAPDGELIVPATAANGIGFQVLSPAFTGDATVTAHIQE